MKKKENKIFSKRHFEKKLKEKKSEEKFGEKNVVRILFAYLATVLGRLAIVFVFILTGILPFKYLAEALSI